MSADIHTTSQRAAVVAATRTGSSWLISLLDSHPEMRFLGELFNLEHAPIAAVRDPAAYLDDRLGGGSYRVVGFKLLYHQARLSYLNHYLGQMDEGRPSQVDWRELFARRPVTPDAAPAIEATWNLVRAGGVRIVHLRRRNLLRRHLSHAILMARSRASWRGVTAPALPRIRLCAQQLASIFGAETAESEAIDRFFAASPQIDVFYEDLLRDFAAECSRIQRFLGVRVAEPEPVRTTAAPPSLRECIENYDEVEQALVGSAWQHFLDES